MSWQSYLFNCATRVFFKAPLSGGPFAEMRAKMAESLEKAAGFLTPPERVAREAVVLGGVPCEWVDAAGCHARSPVVMYCHGGAFTAGSVRTHLDVAWRLSAAARARVLLVDYRLAPQSTFPAPIDDCMAVYQALTSALPATSVAFAGDSAGANILLALALRLRDRGDRLPAACICLSPWVDLTLSGESVGYNRNKDALLPVELLRQAARAYAADFDPAAPELSPLFGDLAGLPPLWICASDTEVLLDDARRLASRARAAGVSVNLEVWRDQTHAFPTVAACVPEGRVAIASIGRFLEERFSVWPQFAAFTPPA